jgi:hypothetical protein
MLDAFRILDKSSIGRVCEGFMKKLCKMGEIDGLVLPTQKCHINVIYLLLPGAQFYYFFTVFMP